MRQREHGFTFVLVVLALASMAVLAIVELLGSRASPTARTGELDVRFDRARDALVAFVAQQRRLPCPANPGADDGLAVPAGPSNTCTYQNGTIPWRTIGLQRESAYDAWDWKISYRVYAGGIGLTRDDGVTAVDCHTDNPAPASGPGGTVAGKCRDAPQKSTTLTEYLAGKGLALNDHGNALNDVAFVLVSHGSSGRGAYSATSGPAPAPASADESANLLAAGPFVAKAGSGPTVSPDSPAHFDDVVRYMTLRDLLTKAGLRERDWPP
jgi:hypothetical protein